MNAEQKNVQLSILFADISGSTALYDKLGNEMALHLVSRTLEVLKREMAAHHGTLIKTIGDEIMCTFPTADLAVNAARAMQMAIEGESPVNGQHIYVRIGHTLRRSHPGIRRCFRRCGQRCRTRHRDHPGQTDIDHPVRGGQVAPELRKKARPVMRGELRGKESHSPYSRSSGKKTTP